MCMGALSLLLFVVLHSYKQQQAWGGIDGVGFGIKIKDSAGFKLRWIVHYS